MDVGTRVSLNEGGRAWTGTVTAVREDGALVSVKWDTGMTERIASEELEPLENGGAPYEQSDPKSEGYHSRMSDLWDMRER